MRVHGRREGYGDGYVKHGWGEFHAVSNKVLQGGGSALNHHVIQWPKKTTMLFWTSYRPWAAHFGRFLACQLAR